MKLPTKDQLKNAFHFGLVALSLTPPVLAAIGAVYPPAAALGLAIQNLLSGFGSIQPGLVQGVLGAIGAKNLRDSEPKPA